MNTRTFSFLILIPAALFAMIQTQHQSPMLFDRLAAAEVQQPSLVSTLTNALGVSTPQASGGAGSLLQLAKQQLSGNDFSRITSAIPDSPQLLKAAASITPTKTDDSLLGTANLLSGASKLNSQFSALGLDSSMISKFADVIMNYLKKYQGSETAKLLEGILPSSLSNSADSLLDAFK
ncbi:MAG: DUF2780 domain-containing protein [Endozoicomonas sp.]